MLIPNSVWKRIRNEFSEPDKAALNAAVNGSIVCPPSASIDERSLSADLRDRLETAIGRLNPGA